MIVSFRIAFAVLVFSAQVLAGEPGPQPREVRFDRYGYRLPSGATARLGVPPQTNGAQEIAWSADAKRFVVTSSESINTFDAVTGHLIQSQGIRDFSTNLTALSRDGSLLFRVRHGNVHLTDAEFGELVSTFSLPKPIGWKDGESTPVHSLNFSSNGRFLVGVLSHGKESGTPWRYDLAKGVYSQFSKRTDVSSICLSPDGRWAYGTTIAKRSNLIRWELPTGRETWSVALTENGCVHQLIAGRERIATVFEDNVRVLDASTGKELLAIPLGADTSIGYRGLDFSWDGKLVALVAEKRLQISEVIVWDIESAKIRFRLAQPGHRIAFSPDGKSLLTASGWVQCWDMSSGQPKYPVPIRGQFCHEGQAIQWSTDGRRLLTWLMADHIQPRPSDGVPDVLTVWDVASMAPVWQFSHQAGLRAAAMDWHGKTVWYRTSRGDLHHVNIDGRKGPEVVSLTPPAGPDSPHRQEAITRVGRLLLQLQEKTKLNTAVYDASTGRRLSEHSIDRRAYLVSLPASRKDGVAMETILYSEEGGQSRVDAITGRRKPAIKAAGGDWNTRWSYYLQTESDAFVLGIGRPPEPRPPASQTGKPSIFLCEAVSASLVADLDPEKWGYLIARSPSGRFIATSDFNHMTIRDLTNPKWSFKFPLGHDSVEFAPDESLVATIGANGTVLIWPLPRPTPAPWKESEATQLWTDLASDNAAQAWKAVWRLLDYREQAVVIMAKQSKPIAHHSDTSDVIARLDDEKFSVREEAMRELARRGGTIEGDLHAALKKAKSEEQRKRLDSLLKKLDTGDVPTGNVLRDLRSIWLLERIGTPEAKKLLVRLASGASGSPVTMEAKSALERLAK